MGPYMSDCQASVSRFEISATYFCTTELVPFRGESRPMRSVPPRGSGWVRLGQPLVQEVFTSTCGKFRFDGEFLR
jgi:hypothetical protein